MNAKLVIKRHTAGPLKGQIETWWVNDELGHRWEIFSYDPPTFSVQYDTGESCGTGKFVMAVDQALVQGLEYPGIIQETPVGEFGVPCELEFAEVRQPRGQ